MHAFANRGHIHNLHVSEVSFSGHMALHPGAGRFAEEEANDSQHQGDWQQQETRPMGARALKRQPGQRPGQERRGDQVRPAARMDGESALPGAQTGIRFFQCRADLLGLKVTEDEEAGRVRVPTHVDVMCARQHVKRGMLESMIASCFENIGEVEYHDFIIA